MSDTTANLQRKLASAQDLLAVVRTMKALAASSIGQYEDSVRALGDYYRTVELGLSVCFRYHQPSSAGLLHKVKASDQSVGVVVFGSDQGLVGQFNEQVVDSVTSFLAGLPTGRVQVWAVGERVGARLVDTGVLTEQLFSVPNSVQTIAPLVGEILLATDRERVPGEMAELHLFYNRSQSGASYEPVRHRLLRLTLCGGANWPSYAGRVTACQKSRATR